MKQLKAFILGIVLTAAGALWFSRLNRADVYYDPMNDPGILQCTFVMHPHLQVDQAQHDHVAEQLGFCKPKTGYHYYPCRCGLVKP